MKAPHEALTAEHVAQILGEAAEFGEAEIGEYLRDVRSFAADGVLTNNAGFTIRLEDGSEFQVTVVQSRPTHPDYLPEDGTLENPDDDDDVNHQRLMNGADPTLDPDGRDDPDAFLEGEFLAERVRTPDGFGTCIQYDRDHNHAAVDLDEGGTWQGSGDDIQLETEWRADMEDIDRTAFGHDGSQVTRAGVSIQGDEPSIEEQMAAAYDCQLDARDWALLTRPAHSHNDICADCNKICAPGELDEHDLCHGCAAEHDAD